MIDEEINPENPDEMDEFPEDKPHQPPLGPDGRPQHLPHEAWHIDQPGRRRPRRIELENEEDKD